MFPDVGSCVGGISKFFKGNFFRPRRSRRCGAGCVLRPEASLKVHRVGHMLRPDLRACSGIASSCDWVPVTFPRREVAIALHETPHVIPHVRRLVAALQGETGRAELMAALGLADRSHFLRTYLPPSLDAGLIEMTGPQSPRSRNQRYRLTALGGEARNSPQESEEEGITERTGRP